LDLIIKARQQIQDNAENTLKKQLEIYYHPLTLDDACVIIDVFPREYIPLLKDLPEQKAEYYSKAIMDLMEKAKQKTFKSRKFYTLTTDLHITEREFPKEP